MSVTALTDQQKSVLKANFNPNCLLNKFNPDSHIYKPVDKSDLAVYSTEFCFSSMGYYEIISLGIVSSIGPSDKNILASKKVRGMIKIYDVYKETTQKDFCNDNSYSSNGVFETPVKFKEQVSTIQT